MFKIGDTITFTDLGLSKLSEYGALASFNKEFYTISSVNGILAVEGDGGIWVQVINYEDWFKNMIIFEYEEVEAQIV